MCLCFMALSMLQGKQGVLQRGYRLRGVPRVMEYCQTQSWDWCTCLSQHPGYLSL